MNSGVSLASMLLGGVVGVIVGIFFAVSRQWFRDLRDTKAKVPKLRKGAWSSLWTLTKAGAAVVLILAVMGWWVYRDVADRGPTPLLPSTAPITPPDR